MIKNILIFVFVLFLMSCASTPSFLSMPSTSPAEGHGKHYALTDPTFWQGNPSSLWAKLSHIPMTTLESSETTAPTPDATGWLKLAVISKRYNMNTPQLAEQLMAWRTEYPHHPGNSLFPADATLSTLKTTSLPKHIAVLLPLQGKLGAMGQSVRDGFLNGYYENHAEQAISFYDTSNSTPLAALYQKALNEGANIVIGPLSKENVQELARTSRLTVPTVALNYTSGNIPNLYQFGLSSSDETQQAAEKAWSAGHSRALLIVEKSAWGDNSSKNLIARWQSQGGVIADTLYFTPQTDFNTAIAGLLHIDPKADRVKTRDGNSKQQLAKQRRHDFDVIFLLAHPDAARAIVPQLRYYYVDKTPIYSTSAIYSGSPSPTKDLDLNGVLFSELPFVLKQSSPATGSDSRLFAVGHDAYLISHELPRLTTLPYFPIYASTGALVLNSQHHIYRRLPWAKMHDGHP